MSFVDERLCVFLRPGYKYDTERLRQEKGERESKEKGKDEEGNG